MANQATRTRKPRVFVDADVLIAGAASPRDNGASLVILRLAEITLIEALACQQVVVEAERNIEAKLPAALPAFRLLVARCLHVVDDPVQDLVAIHDGLADPKDLPLLVAALRTECEILVTFNVRDYHPTAGSIAVLRPGELVTRVRDRLAGLGQSDFSY